MKFIKSLLILSLAVFVIGACSKKEESGMDEMKENTEQAYETAEEGVAKTKEAFVDDVNKQLAEMEKEMESVGNKIEESTGEGKEALKQQWDKLQEQKQSLEDKLADLQEEGEENWTQVREEINTTWTSLEQSFQALKKKVEGA